MSLIKVEQLDETILKQRGIFDWPTWSKEESEFPWHYEEREQCLIVRGDVTVTTESGESVRFGVGDFVTFPQGLTCTWTVHRAVHKHYNFG